YTMRRFYPVAMRLDIEYAAHDDGGPASEWALLSREGGEMGLYPEGLCSRPPSGTDWRLMVGDVSSVPAVMSIVEQATHDQRAVVYLEVPTPDDVRTLDAPAGVEVHWLPREDPRTTPGRLALETVCSAGLPKGRPYCWIAGESGLPTGLRRRL